MNITNNDIKFALKILKSETYFNANTLAKELNISPMGALKIARKLIKYDIIKKKGFGKAFFYKINLSNDFSKSFINLCIADQLKSANPQIKRWANEISQLRSFTHFALLFGSVTKSESYNDIDLILVYNKRENKRVEETIKRINQLSKVKLHTIHQTMKDFQKNLRNKNKVLLNAVKEGIVCYGNNKFLEAIKDFTEQK